MIYTGKITDTAGNAIAGAGVTLVDANNNKIKDTNKNVLSVNTDAAGMYFIDIPALSNGNTTETRKLRVEKGGFKSSIISFGSSVSLAKQTNLDNVQAAADFLKKLNTVLDKNKVQADAGGSPITAGKEAPVLPPPPKEPISTGMYVVIGVSVLAVTIIIIGTIRSFNKK